MSILNVNQIQPVGGGNTITVSASDVSASGVTITASSFVGPVTGNVTSSSTSTFSSGINVTGGSVGIGTDNPTTILHLRDNSPILTTEASNGASGLRVNVLGQTSDTSQLFRIQNDNSTKFTILKSGNVQIADGNLVVASGHGIDFSADGNASGMTSELLDDYEEGTFTPSFVNYGSPSVSVAEGEYVKIGGSVFLSIRMVWTGGSNSSSSRVSGLPFAMTDSHIKVNGWAQKGNAEGSAVYRLATTGISNTAIFYQPIRDETSGVFYGTIQITSLS